MKKKEFNVYVAPVTECIEIHTEQCIAISSGEASGDLSEMGPNDLVSDFAMDPTFMGLF